MQGYIYQIKKEMLLNHEFYITLPNKDALDNILYKIYYSAKCLKMAATATHTPPLPSV